MTFASPGYLFLLLLLVPIVGWYIWKLHGTQAAVQLSSTASLQQQPKSLRVWLIHVPFVLRVLLVILLSLALARPQLSNRWQSESTEGIDIMMALDISGTMLGEDLKPNRLEAAKAVATDFVLSRPNDQIGLVVFAGESFTQCPLTTDHAVLVNLFQSVKFGMIEDGTAIGLGLANAVNRMKDSPTKSKVVILLTDGSNNRGDIDPQTAAEIAKTFNIRVYAIGVGSYSKEVKVPIHTPYGVQYGTMSSEFDETTLRTIAQMTGGEYFRATDNNSLRAIYSQIDQLEKTKIRVREYSKRTEHFAPFLMAALACLLLELLIRYCVLRTVAE
jgi:Ca-activated chloride channel family protein